MLRRITRCAHVLLFLNSLRNLQSFSPKVYSIEIWVDPANQKSQCLCMFNFLTVQQQQSLSLSNKTKTYFGNISKIISLCIKLKPHISIGYIHRKQSFLRRAHAVELKSTNNIRLIILYYSQSTLPKHSSTHLETLTYPQLPSLPFLTALLTNNNFWRTPTSAMIYLRAIPFSTLSRPELLPTLNPYTYCTFQSI